MAAPAMTLIVLTEESLVEVAVEITGPTLEEIP
jgi:hypothetical protein